MHDTARILVVDDAAENRMLLKVFLKARAVRVDEASDGAEALERLALERYDLVLMDVHMPNMDGLSATRAFRARERAGERTPIVALTADDSERDRMRSLDAGCDAHLVKPVTRAVLLATLDRWLAGRTTGA